MNRLQSFLGVLLILVLLNHAALANQTISLDSLRLVVQGMVGDSSETATTKRRVLSAYLYQARSNYSPEDIIYAYQQLAAVNYNSGDINQALKYYKLYVLELEELTEFEEYRDQQFQINLYENEIRALKEQVGELEAEIQLLRDEKAINYEKNYLIYIGLRISLVIAIVLILGWLYQRYRKAKRPAVMTAEPASKHHELAEILTQTKNQLINAETELSLADILVQREIYRAEEYFESNKSFRRKFLFSQPRALSSGAGLYLHTIKNQTIAVIFNSASSGAPGGLLAAQVYRQLDDLVKNLGLTSPALVLDQLEKNIAQLFPAGIPFTGGISCGVLLYDNSIRSITFCGANFDLHEVSHGHLHVHEGSRKSITFDDDQNERQNLTIEVGKGSNFYLCTDTFWRQEGGHEFKALGRESFEKTIVSIYRQNAEDQQLVIKKVYEEWLGGNEQIGDVLVFGVLL